SSDVCSSDLEVVAFIPGTVPNYPLPDYVWDEETLVTSARMLRDLHDATAGYRDPDAQWRLPAHEPVEVICHNDFAPYNMVFRDGGLVGMIDFDMASPGSRLWDLAYLAYRLAPLSSPGNAEAGPFDTAEQLERLQRLIDAYGTPFPIPDVLRMVQERLRDLARSSDEAAIRNGNAELHGHATLYRADDGYVGGLVLRLTRRPYRRTWWAALFGCERRTQGAAVRAASSDKGMNTRHTAPVAS